MLVPSLAALSAALVAEGVLGIRGCDLCLLQRYPYVVTAALAAIATLLPRPSMVRLVFAACAAFFALVCGLAVYHAGIQQGWWAEAGLCVGSLPAAPSDLRALRLEARPACDEIDWSVLGLSLAALSAIYAAALAIVATRFALCIVPCGGRRQDSP